jgi:hypothetical protein
MVFVTEIQLQHCEIKRILGEVFIAISSNIQSRNSRDPIFLQQLIRISLLCSDFANFRCIKRRQPTVLHYCDCLPRRNSPLEGREIEIYVPVSDELSGFRVRAFLIR